VRYLRDYEQLHREGHFPGDSLLPRVHHLLRLVDEFGATSLLDYGCGKGSPWERDGHLVELRARLEVRLYDPAWQPHSKPLKPGRVWDVVVCTDVLEHVPEDELDELLADLFGRAKLALLVHVSTRGSAKRLPRHPGQDAHCTVRPREWWTDQLGERVLPGQTLWLTFEP
jgi:hypothetical protein